MAPGLLGFVHVVTDEKPIKFFGACLSSTCREIRRNSAALPRFNPRCFSKCYGAKTSGDTLSPISCLPPREGRGIAA